MHFWLRVEAVASRLHAPRRVCMWLLMRAAAAVRYEPLGPESGSRLEAVVKRALWWMLYSAGAALIVGQIAWWLL
jgi:hypothetical protein